MKHERCNAIGCNATTRRDEVFCPKHLVMVESDTRTVLGRTFRPSRWNQSATFEETLDRARREVLYFQTEGHHVPRDRPFMWDDEPQEML